MTYILAAGCIALLLAYMTLLVKYRQLREPDPWEQLLKRGKRK